MAERLVDFVAAGRVAKRVEFKDIRVTDISAKCDPKIKGPLEPTLNHECIVVGHVSNALEIGCNYHFVARAAEAQAADAVIKYLIIYEVQGSEPLTEEDLVEFAFANGILHSWPFAREFLYGLTSKMGYPAYILPAFHFKPKPPEKKELAEKPAAKKELESTK